MFDRQGSHGQSKSVLRFTAPAEVKGVALLIFNHPEGASDQWMWTPAIERDRRIAFQDRSTRFFGTDFTFEDLEERDVDQYDHNARRRYRRRSRLLENPVDAQEDPVFSVHTLDRLDPERQLHDRTARHFVKDDAVRRLLLSNLENIQGIWTARLLDMTDLRRGTHTRLSLQQVKYNSFMKDEAFTLQAIRR
jgi:Outer membrane lipoprotein-sorting protein